jgi:hypothetical protein
MAGASCPNHLIEDAIHHRFELRDISVQELLKQGATRPTHRCSVRHPCLT